MTKIWGDESWDEIAYEQPHQGSLFGDGPEFEKRPYSEVAKAFRKRLREVAGFSVIPEPVLMRNSKSVPLYYLYFATHKEVAGGIIGDIFDRYRRLGDVG